MPFRLLSRQIQGSAAAFVPTLNSNLDKLSFVKTYTLIPATDSVSSDWITDSNGKRITKDNAKYLIVEIIVTGTSNMAYTRVFVASANGTTVLDAVESSVGASNTPIVYYDNYGYLKFKSQGILSQNYVYKVKISIF